MMAILVTSATIGILISPSLVDCEDFFLTVVWLNPCTIRAIRED
jgi:hypothetical protein